MGLVVELPIENIEYLGSMIYTSILCNIWLTLATVLRRTVLLANSWCGSVNILALSATNYLEYV